MKTIIAGSRTITDLRHIQDATDSCFWTITEVVSGCAPGVDTLGETYAKSVNIPIKQFPADWKTHKRAAGPIRNQQMADYSDALLAIWDGKSKGTADMIRRARQAKLQILIHIVEPVSKLDADEFQ